MSNSQHVGKHINATALFTRTCRCNPDAKSVFFFFWFSLRADTKPNDKSVWKTFKRYFGHPPKLSLVVQSLDWDPRLWNRGAFFFFSKFYTACAPLCGCGQLRTRGNVLGWLENIKWAPLIEQTNKNIQSPKIHITSAYIQLVSWYQVKEKELTLSALSSMGSHSRSPPVASVLRCFIGPYVFLFGVILCCATFSYPVMCLRSD